MYKMKKCALCGSKEKLELSHIIPKMAFRKLKKTAIGGIRYTASPNLTVQDSEKKYMLCGKCEDKFSKIETWFANNIFHPYIDDKKESFSYGKELIDFIISVSWRILYFDILDFDSNNKIGNDALECLVTSEGIMRDYLLEKRSDIGTIENHIVFLREIEGISGDFSDINEIRPNETFNRSVGGYTLCYEELKTNATIINMMGILLVTLYSKGEMEKWENTRVDTRMGVIKTKKQIIKSVVGNELFGMMKKGKSASDSMSGNQKSIVKKRIKKAEVKNKKYSIYKDWEADERLRNDFREKKGFEPNT